MSRCVLVDKRLSCTMDLADGGTLRILLENTLSSMVAEHPEVNLTLQEYVPAFVDALIASANSCNQSSGMVDIAHELIENEPTPERCWLIIDAMKNFRAEALCTCEGGSSATVHETGGAIHPVKFQRTWVDKYVRITMGKLWFRVLKAMGREDTLEDPAAGNGGGVRG